MLVRVNIHIDSTPLLLLTRGKPVVTVYADTVQDALAKLGDEFPVITPNIFDENGKVRNSVMVRLNKKDIRQPPLKDLATELEIKKKKLEVQGYDLTIEPAYRTCHRFSDVSARKVRPFAALIRGCRADEALELLRFLPNRSARLLEQVLKTALGNAENHGARHIDSLRVVESRVDGGPQMKRIQPRARGTAYTIRRRFSHIHLILSEGEE